MNSTIEQQDWLREVGGLLVNSYFTSEKDPYDEIEWKMFDSVIKDKTGGIVFEQRDIEAPGFWSQTAVDIAASKYFRGQIGTPQRETSIKQMISRVTNTIREWGVEGGYFSSLIDADIFEKELRWLLVHQYMSFNSPVWFNCGASGRTKQFSACFILDLQDSMGSILDWIKTEGVIFKGGSGSGVNVSRLRAKGEKLSDGGSSSGPLSFMRGADSVAGSIKSGGATRRAAKSVIMDADHPDVEEFINCKAEEEEKVRALGKAGWDVSFDADTWASVQYQNANNSVSVTDSFMRAVRNDADWNLTYRRDGSIAKTIPAKSLLRQIAYATWRSGDPGLYYHDTINRFNTTANSGTIVAANPCQPGWANVLTSEGMRTFDDIEVGSTIWSGKQWTRVTKKVATGNKPVYQYETTAGRFIGTEEHKVFQDGKRVMAMDAIALDSVVGSKLDDINWDNQLVMDGWVLGDGSVHKASNDLVFLCVGTKDQDIHTKLPEFVKKHRPGVSAYAWEVGTTLTAEELPVTYERRVPNRFKYANARSVASFLRGMYSANGSIAGGRITYKSSSLSIIHDVQDMLSSIGIPSYYTVNKPSKTTWKNGEYTSRQSYDLNITRGRKDFVRLIGFVQDDKQIRAEDVAKRPVGLKTKQTYDIVDREFMGIHPVYDITVEADEHSYWTSGILVSNCFEFVAINNTACNLASINLMKFAGEDCFDIDGFRKIVEISIIAQEILVSPGEYPTSEITKNANAFRHLGLGFTNLGALLMFYGLPYDSVEGRNLAAAITSMMTGHAYKTSAQIASIVGPFSGYRENADVMLKVQEGRADTASVFAKDCSGWVADVARDGSNAWAESLALGRTYGWRNCDVTVIAPTGTISFIMDADTTGIEPDIALVKYKKLVGGGTFKLVNKTLSSALRRLGYTENEVEAIVEYVHDKDTIEGAPGLKQEHLPVFDCAFVAQNGTRSISPYGHVGMMAAVQKFLSMGVSKTVNLPHDATVEDIMDVYVHAWENGVKAIAIYRDGSKEAQPLSTASTDANTTTESVKVVEVSRPSRRKLPVDRKAITHKFSVGDFEGYLTVGLYEDGSPGELFVRIAKQGSTLAGVMDSFAVMTSIALQYGVPLDALIDKFSYVQFEPNGITDNSEIRFATSVIDYIFRYLQAKFTGEIDQEINVVNLENSIIPDNINKEIKKISSSGPPCYNCGGITQRAGPCFVCSSCGSTSGCS